MIDIAIAPIWVVTPTATDGFLSDKEEILSSFQWVWADNVAGLDLEAAYAQEEHLDYRSLSLLMWRNPSVQALIYGAESMSGRNIIDIYQKAVSLAVAANQRSPAVN